MPHSIGRWPGQFKNDKGLFFRPTVDETGGSEAQDVYSFMHGGR